MKKTLEALFHQPIVSVKALGEQYDGRANDVWLISLQDKTEYVVKSPKTAREESEFVSGIKMIYGVDDRTVQEHIDQINQKLSHTHSFHIPEVVRKVKKAGRQFYVMEKVEGTPCTSFEGRSSDFYKDYGRKLAQLHSYRTDFFGAVYGAEKKHLREFHAVLKKAVSKLIDRYYADQPEFHCYAEIVLQKIEKLRTPDSASLILIDLDPSQYIENDDQVTSLVDTEYVVYGPAAFDFIALEYLLTKEAARNVQLGYEEICPLPRELHEVRECYRFVSLLLDIHGSWDLKKWMNHPILFDSYR
ncbi:aminoglycoside phosphotransferase family protein [Bacillus safensis]|uniref:aminoglycoside phosphotransferase family protein n=1 Tax=Bacillus safensis TaxID=561879 RepID=UPI002238431D|nr:aminoglycoside phosphotransferase family protein [Bacillus safensis]MCW4643944.1 aminoglycoside phosphotransferase family protein [Bacillus safensis]MCY7563648.1 aminoglycoside phosphotransferase family protein [Bacillus safensis]MCY7626750.1 aminoglycoside phosphotransferase family protein [Bacillus safensis]MCY7633090.1 aminoglycoside phosphotransferase family protein [Bacillus safensis]MCY7648881.1 aminoglycoside phosphotransferase family protein [Bacillus safensis]